MNRSAPRRSLCAGSFSPSTRFFRPLSLVALEIFRGRASAVRISAALAPAVSWRPSRLLMIFLTSETIAFLSSYHYRSSNGRDPFALPVPSIPFFLRRKKKSPLPLLVLASILFTEEVKCFFWRIYQADAHQAWLRDNVLPALEKERSRSAATGSCHLSTRHWVTKRDAGGRKNGSHRLRTAGNIRKQYSPEQQDIERIRTTLAGYKYETDSAAARSSSCAGPAERCV